MTTAATPSNVPALGAHAREDVGNELQATLLELIDLALVGKQLHWSVVGPEFRSLHLQLDEFIDSWRELADTVAECAVAIGYAPNGQASAVAASSGLDALERGLVEDRELVRLLTRRLAEIGEGVRGRTDRVGELDTASQDTLIEVVRELEKQLWMTRAQSPTDREEGRR